MDSGFFKGMTIGVAGLGLIGGSLAKAFSRAGFTVYGFDRDPVTVRASLETGAVSESSTNPERLFGADAVFVALYPDGIVSFITENAARFKEGSIVLDCCGIKGRVMEKLAPVADNAKFHLIGGHPMAGTERSGFEASHPEIFENASFILTPSPSVPQEVLTRAGTLVKAAGFARVIVTTPERHDRIIAFTSQLPHVLACAYVESPTCAEHRGFSAGSFRDVSRVAHINPELWAGLFIENRSALLSEIDTLSENIREIRSAVDSRDEGRLITLLRRARELKDGADHEE